MATAAPRKAMMARLVRLVPKWLSHISGRACQRKLAEVFDDISDPSRIPRTNIHCHSILGTLLLKYAICETRSGLKSFSINPAERTKDVEAPKNFPAIQTDSTSTTPLNA